MKPEYTENAKLALDKLSVGYHGKALIKEITLQLKPGEILTLIGPNGSGKTTILKSISKQLASIGGVVAIDGRDIRRMNGKEVSQKMAVVLTERVRPELMTCRELVSAGRYPYTGSFGLLTEKDKEIVANALKMVRAADIADRDVSEISDGQRQRILLARAICQEPEIIVLDEPTSYLDVRHKVELLEILRDMAKRQNITVVMSLHEIDLAEKISDKIVCVKGERIAGYGTPDEIFTDEKIAQLYDMERGSYNALFGCVELAKPPGAPKCFVVGGNGCGIPYYRALQKAGVPFAAGILFANDADCAVARALAETAVIAASFSPIEEAQIQKAKQLIDGVNAVIDTGCPVGEYNRANGELLTYARTQGKTMLTSLRELEGVAL